MTVRLDPKAWTQGVADAYAGRPQRADEAGDDALAYASGRVEGEALRLRHEQEYHRLLFSGRQTRPLPAPGEPSHG